MVRMIALALILLTAITTALLAAYAIIRLDQDHTTRELDWRWDETMRRARQTLDRETT